MSIQSMKVGEIQFARFDYGWTNWTNIGTTTTKQELAMNTGNYSGPLLCALGWDLQNKV